MSNTDSTKHLVKITVGKGKHEYLCMRRMIACDENGDPLKIDTIEICMPEKIKKPLSPSIENKIDSSQLEEVEDVGYIYLLKNHDLGILKIGFSFNIHERIENHKKRGFKSIEILKIFENRARAVEQFLISFIKCNWVPFGSVLFTNKFDGWSECWNEKHFPVYSFGQLRECIIDYATNCLPFDEEDNGK